MALQPAPHLGDSYWATTAQLLAADAAESDEELTRALTSDTNTLSAFASSAVPPPLKNQSSAETTPPRTSTDADELETATAEITTTANGGAVVAQARRMRDRLKVRRLYYRKLERLNDLRAQVSALEAQLETSALSQQQRRPHAPDATDLLQTLARTRQQLTLENEFLRQRMGQSVRVAHAISVKLLELREPPTAFLHFKAVTRRECADMRRWMLAEVLKLARNRERFQYTGSVRGWASTQLLLDGVYSFHLEKSVPSVQAATVAERTWAVLSDPTRFAKLYASAVEMKCYLLQVVDADSVVMFHEHRTMDPTEERERVVRTVLLLARTTTPAGYVITLASLDRDKWVLEDLSLREVQDAVVWNEVFCWLQYSDMDMDMDGDGGCVCTFAGVAPIVGESVYFWMMEFIQVALRWEADVMGAASYLLQSSSTE